MSATLFLHVANIRYPENERGRNCLSSSICLQVLNADVQPRSYWAVVNDAQAVSLQVSIVASVLEMHNLLLTGGVGVQSVLMLVVALICFGQVFVRHITGMLCIHLHSFSHLLQDEFL